MNRTAVVTGAAQGVGLVTATLLAQCGYEVWLADIQNLDAQVARLKSAPLRVRGVSGDVSSEEFARQLAAQVQADCGGADVLVNNAGISLIAAAEATTAAQWQRVMDINLLGPFLLCKHLGAAMLARTNDTPVNAVDLFATILELAGTSVGSRSEQRED